MTVKIDAELAINTLREVVAEKGPDYIYEDEMGRTGAAANCVNFHQDGSPACIAGHVYQRWLDQGILAPEQWELIDRRSGVGSVFASIYLTVAISNGAAAVLTEAQERQDLGEPWGVALRRAEDMYDHVSHRS